MIRAEDDRDYWCKALNNPVSERIPINEQIAGHLGAGIGVAVAAPTLVRLDGLEGWEFHPGKRIEPGWAHGCAAVEGAIETRSLDHRSEDSNRVRHAGFFALMDWLAGGDQQWLYGALEENAYYSHDHGHFFPGGPDWTAEALSATGTAARMLGVPSDGLDSTEIQRLAAAIEGTQIQALETVMSKIPQEWPVGDEELAALVDFIAARSAAAAGRLRALVT